jgi:hypothetical protein
VRWAAARITPAQRELLAAMPRTIEMDIDGLGRAIFCHGTPRSEDEIVTQFTSERRLQSILAGVEARVVVGGHTHVQYDRHVLGRRLINAGSVGMPFEGRTGAFWALLGPDVELRRTEYDVERAAREILASDYPRAEQFAHKDLLSPASPTEMSELFERMAEERAKQESAR